ncbi:MAG TPA: alpha/beta hydrolase [Candidatus Limnocylindrales bacterium]|nr:alpha/beta hydrolase [Candidatus Limnocylindrales bacterium]
MPIERTVDLARIGASARIQEVGDGPAVLFIHGANTSGASWASLAAGLPELRCLLVDRPGTGLSPALTRRPNREGLREFAASFVVDVLDGLGLERADLVATSLGGYIALRSAAAHPERVRRMVQFGWPVGAPSDGLQPLMRLAALPGVGRLAAGMPFNDRSVRWLFRRMGHGPAMDDGRITSEEIGAYVALLRDTDTLRNELGRASAFVSPVGGLAGFVLDEAALAGVTAPTLFAWGEHDSFGSPAVGRAIVRRMPAAEIQVIRDAGHTPWMDDLEACVAAVRTFLAPATSPIVPRPVPEARSIPQAGR